MSNYIGPASGAALGYIFGNVPGAIAGYKYGKYASVFLY